MGVVTSGQHMKYCWLDICGWLKPKRKWPDTFIGRATPVSAKPEKTGNSKARNRIYAGTSNYRTQLKWMGIPKSVSRKPRRDLAILHWLLEDKCHYSSRPLNDSANWWMHWQDDRSKIPYEVRLIKGGTHTHTHTHIYIYIYTDEDRYQQNEADMNKLG